MPLHWHRRDLRPADNVGLAAAADAATDDAGTDAPDERADGDLLALFVLDDALLAHAGPPRVAFMLEALAELRGWYRDHGSDLLLAHGDPREVVPEVAVASDVDLVTWNRDYSKIARERDSAVRRELADREIDRASYDDAVCHAPGSILTSEGEHYSVFSYYWRKWAERDPGEPPAAPDADRLASPDRLAAVEAAKLRNLDDPIPGLDDLGVPEPTADVQPGTRADGLDRLHQFCDGPIYEYDDRRDDPAAAATSRLSPHLSFGTLGPREVHAAVEAAKADAPDDDARENSEEYRRQLCWREFYAQVLADNPDMPTTPLKDFQNPIEWRDDPEALQAWKDGKTGFPIVDAGMRQLREEAFMHNRLRMIVASFLTKDLLLDWREGLAWFRERLVDHDPANDAGGWQWAASVGVDAQPYFRVFNPVTQGERHDPDAEYIRRYVPELRDVEPDVIHDWSELSPTQRQRTAPAYPAPIVDHAERREEAIATFERARGDE
ncbi:deoxyribodipyrimidine photolyase [Salinarchaeum sp. Harcht-Bsk1]|uniref:cryptochrome/photolyase family protein n=1 Tax=Salinarchaeum sp. Harcht-Bsk1 TaxID=1333523 RepID=UPI0003422838|nr:deoxyribodipyrimidine photo-lyase [Salinarchaeum sp. Harcht-Bsk1]AGN01268.1 deoxyribodipyrimidine photolyase [Salinarchaeum sp. Harcht-Bsk1]